MKRDFTDDHFEDFLKHQADGLRMKAPDRVWQNLSKELNGRRRRLFFGLGALLLATGTVGYFGLTRNGTDITAVNNTANPITRGTVQEKVPAPNANGNGAGSVNNDKPATTAKVISITSFAARQPRNRISQPTPETAVATGPSSPSTDAAAVNDFTPTVVDSYTEFDADASAQKNPVALRSRPDAELPLSIESVVNSFRKKRGRIERQFYFTPTVSYRKLTENKSYLRSLPPSGSLTNLASMYSSVNNMVTHKPDLGFEIGYTAKYAVSNRVKLRSGVQFNVNRYDVRAFSSQPAVATIALASQNRVDSLSTVSRYSNVNGYKINWLQNFSFQVSAPVGVELLLGNNPNAQFGIAGTVQPTYVLGDRAYLITTDYKSYAFVPSLIRRWNVNTALETFVSLKTGKSRLQVGPQVRYQLLSSFNSEYPVKENLFDYGLKVGISLNN